MTEEVNHPDHYGGDTPYETIKVLQAWLSPEQFVGFCRGNALKYLSRAGKKGALLVDLEKAKFYQEYEIKTTRPLLGVEVVVNGESHVIHPDDVLYLYEQPMETVLENSLRPQAIPDSEKLLFAKALFREIAEHPTVERNPDGTNQASVSMQLIAKEALEKLEKF